MPEKIQDPGVNSTEHVQPDGMLGDAETAGETAADSSRSAGEITSWVISPGRVLPPYLQPNPTDASGRSGDIDPGEFQRSRWAVLTVLFLVTGAFGLPLLWRSDRFGMWERWVWSIVVVAYTIGLFALIVTMIRWSVRQPGFGT